MSAKVMHCDVFHPIMQGCISCIGEGPNCFLFGICKLVRRRQARHASISTISSCAAACWKAFLMFWCFHTSNHSRSSCHLNAKSIQKHTIPWGASLEGGTSSAFSIRSAQNVGKVWINRNRHILTLLQTISDIFSWAKKCKNGDLFRICSAM